MASEDRARGFVDAILGAGVDFNPTDAFFAGFNRGTPTQCPKGHKNVVASGGKGTCFDCAAKGDKPDYNVL